MDDKTLDEFVEFMQKDHPSVCLHYCLINKKFVMKDANFIFRIFCKGKEAGQKLVITKSFSGERFDPHAR